MFEQDAEKQHEQRKESNEHDNNYAGHSVAVDLACNGEVEERYVGLPLHNEQGHEQNQREYGKEKAGVVPAFLLDSA